MITMHCIAVYFMAGAFRWGIGVLLVSHRVIWCIAAVLCKSLLVILYRVQRGNLGECISA